MRALFDDGGNRVDEAGPSIPVQVCRSYILLFFCFKLSFILSVVLISDLIQKL